MEHIIQDPDIARVTADALAGGGLVLLQGDLVSRGAFPEYFDALLDVGAIELCKPHQGVALRLELF